MLTEFEVRRRIAAIRASRLAPLRKVRMLLRIGRDLETQARALADANLRAARADHPNAAASLARMAQSACLLHEDVREAALRALRTDGPGADSDASESPHDVNCAKTACHGPPSHDQRKIREFAGAPYAASSRN